MPTGDLNNDGIVDAIDLSIFVSRWGSNDPDADLNNDGIVDAADLSILVSNWGETSGSIPNNTILTIASVSATVEDGDNVAANTIDDDLGNRWSGEGWGASLIIDLGQSMPVGAIEIAWHQGDQRRAFFDIHVSSDGSSWSTHYLGAYSSGTTLDFERYDFNNTQTRWLRVFGRGNELNMWNSITGIRVRSHTGIESPGMAPLILSFNANVQNSSVNLQWTATAQTGGTIERATSVSGPWTQIHTLGFIQQPQDSYTDTTALEETDYWYRLLVSNSTGSDTEEVGPVIVPAGSSVVGLALPASLVNQALDEGFVSRYRDGYIYTDAFGAGWNLIAALDIYNGETRAEQKMLQQINNWLVPGHTPGSGGGYWMQHEMQFASTVNILHQSPHFWSNVLSATQREKLSLLMEAIMMWGSWCISDAGTNNGRSWRGSDNWRRFWNPNFQEGLYGGLLQGLIFFGGPANVASMFSSYDHANLRNRLQAADLQNAYGAALLSDSNSPALSTVQSAIRNWSSTTSLHPYGSNVPTAMQIYLNQTAPRTYGEEAIPGVEKCSSPRSPADPGTCGSCERGISTSSGCAGIVLNNIHNFPNYRQLGMLREFNSADASGTRSSLTYAYDGFRPNLCHHVSLIVAGQWTPDSTTLSHLNVGIQDLDFKLQNGYRNYQHGNAGSTMNMDSPNWERSFKTLLPLWNDVLSGYHQL